MGKKKFIDKRASSTFRLVYSAEATAAPGERLFVRTDEGTNYVPGFSDDYSGPTLLSQDGGSEWGAGDLHVGLDNVDVDGFLDGAQSSVDADPRGRSLSASRTGLEDRPRGRAPKVEGAEGARARSTSAQGRLGLWASSHSRGSSRDISASRAASYAPEFRCIEPLAEDVRQEILSLGLPDDGYDYTQHLRVIGSGSKLGAFLSTEKPSPALGPDVKLFDASRVRLTTDGSPAQADSSPLKLADVVSSSSREIWRPRSKTITGLDPEIAAALASDDEELPTGTDDELDDDFVIQANIGSDSLEAGESSQHRGEAGSVDLSTAHLGGFNEDGENQPSYSSARHKAILGLTEKGREGLLSNTDDEDDDYAEEWETDEESERVLGEQLPEGRQHGEHRRGRTQERARPARLLDEQFENLMLREYEDDEYEEPDPEEANPAARGHVKVSDFESVLNEFLLEAHDHQHSLGEARGLLASSNASKGAPEREKAVDARDTKEDSARLELDTGAGSSETNHKWQEVAEGGQISDADAKHNSGDVDTGVSGGSVLKEQLANESAEEAEDEELLWTDGEEEDRKQDTWDCESIVSTYSNLDNHPARIQEPARDQRIARQPSRPLQMAPGLIRLTGKEQLPTDYLPPKMRGAPGRSLGIRRGLEEGSDGGSLAGSAKVAGPRAAETPAARKLRKAGIKADRREARAAKKELRLVYRAEAIRAQHGAALVGAQGVHLC